MTYVDGKKMGLANHKGQIADVETPVIIGDNNRGEGANFRFYGVMDGVAIYNRDLSQGEIGEKMTESHIYLWQSSRQIIHHLGAHQVIILIGASPCNQPHTPRCSTAHAYIGKAPGHSRNRLLRRLWLPARWTDSPDSGNQLDQLRRMYV